MTQKCNCHDGWRPCPDCEGLPVDKAKAMALFVREKGGGRFYVPDMELSLYTVDRMRGEWFCHLSSDLTLCSRGNCEHVQAVKLYMAQKEQS